MWRPECFAAVLALAAAPALSAGATPAVAPAAAAAALILQHLDLDSFPNSMTVCRKPPPSTPADYGLTKLETFDDGWAQISAPDDGWHLSALVLEGPAEAATICFLDTGGKGHRFQATQVLRVQSHANGRWTAVQVGDRYDCRNVPSFDAAP